MTFKFDLIILVPTAHETCKLSRMLGLVESTMPAGELSLRAFFLAENQPEHGLKYCVVQIGMGGDYPRQVLRELVNVCTARYFLLAGTAGGLQPEFPTGTVVLGDRVCYLNNQHVVLQHELNLELAWRSSSQWRTGPILCAEDVINTVEEKRFYYERTAATCVEMESMGCYCVLRESQSEAKFLHMRVVLDDAKTAIQAEVTQLINQQGEMQWWSLFGLIARKPWIVIHLIQLKHLSDMSLRALAKGLLHFVQLLNPTEGK